MSSHHFVREGQEPALFILDPIPLVSIQPLLEWAPLVIISAETVDTVLAWGIKIDVVMAIADQARDITLRMEDQAPVTVQLYDGDLLEAVFHLLLSRRQTALTIVTYDSGPVVPAIDKFSNELNISLLTEHVRWSVISSGNFRKWLEKDTVIQVRSLDPDITLRGTDYTALPADQKIQTPSTKFQTLDSVQALVIREDGILEIVSEGRFWVGEKAEG